MTEKQKWLFFNLYCMAVADGEFAPQEREAIYKLAEKQGISSDTINQLVTEVGPPSVLIDTLKDKIEYLYYLTQIAWADGKIDPAEHAMIKKFVIQFGFPKENADAIIDYFLGKVKGNETLENIMKEFN